MAEGVEHMVLMYGVSDSLIPDGQYRPIYVNGSDMTTVVE